MIYKLLLLSTSLILSTAYADAQERTLKSDATDQQRVARVISLRNDELITSRVQTEIKNKMFPGAVVLLGNAQGKVYARAFGDAQIRPEKVFMRIDSQFDMASITKVVATSTACAILFDRGKLNPDAVMTTYLPDHKGIGVEKISLRRLASHTSGFAENPRLGHQGEGAELFQAMLEESPRWPVNTRYQYACKNSILLSTIVERISGEPFGKFCRDHIFQPLDMHDTAFNKIRKSQRVVAVHAPVELGVSHNIDTIKAGCAIGNAGMFTTALDLSNFWQMMLNKGLWKGKRILSEKVIRDFTRTNQLPRFPAKGFLWETDLKSIHRPTLSSDQAYGHSGYTGQSIWIDPGNRLYTIVLTNRTLMKDHRDPAKKREQYRARSRIGDALIKVYQQELHRIDASRNADSDD